MSKDLILQIPALYKYIQPSGLDEQVIGNCALVCIKMCVDFFKKTDLTLLEFIQQEKPGKDNYDFVSQILNKYSLQTEIWDSKKHRLHYDFLHKIIKNKAWAFGEILSQLQMGNPTIVLVNREREGKLLKHYIVFVGIRREENGEISGFFYNDPDFIDTQSGSQFIFIQDFLKIWSNVIFFIHP